MNIVRDYLKYWIGFAHPASKQTLKIYSLSYIFICFPQEFFHINIVSIDVFLAYFKC